MMCATLALAVFCGVTNPAMKPKQVYGFGIVIGLDGTGSASTFTQQVLCDYLGRCGVPKFLIAPLSGAVARNRMAAAVLVSGDVEARDQFDVSVSPIDDATSLKDGVLLGVKLRCAGGEVCATAQGIMSSHKSNVARIVNGGNVIPVKASK